jgi:hypothetical protein
MDRVLQEPNLSSVKRIETPVNDFGKVVDGERIRKPKKISYLTSSTNKTKEGYVLPNTERIIPYKVRPDNVFRFLTAGAARDNSIKHPAPFHKDLPKYFINLLTDEGDYVLDTFGGIMTTGLSCKEVGNRNFIGFELNEKYAEFGIKRLTGDELDEYRIVQYDMNDNFIQSFNSPTEACKAINYPTFHNILMCYRGHRNEAGGYKWKLEKK